MAGKSKKPKAKSKSKKKTKAAPKPQPDHFASKAVVEHADIRIGTLAGKGAHTPEYISKIIHHGFESFQINFWADLPKGLPMKKLGKQVREVLDAHAQETGHKAVISSLGMFGNPITTRAHAKNFGRCIEACKHFDCDIVAGFAGADSSKNVDANMADFKRVWSPLAKLAKDCGVRIAFENCDMGGNWASPNFNIAHSPTAWAMMFDALGDPGHVGLEWEPCHQLVSLADPIAQLRQWVDKVIHVHGKDATVAWDVIKRAGIRGGQQYVWHRHPGFGDSNWTDIISILRMARYQGTIDIEGWHDPVYRANLEITGQVHALNYLKHCRGGDYVPDVTVG